MKFKIFYAVLFSIVCCTVVNGDEYKKAHFAWLKARGAYRNYARTKTEAGIALVKQEKALKQEIAKRKVELYQTDSKLKDLHDKFLKAQETYKTDKARHNRNNLTTARRVLEGAWKNSKAIKDEKLVAAQNNLRGLNWRNVYVAARAKDPEAQKLWAKYEKAAKAKGAAKKTKK